MGSYKLLVDGFLDTKTLSGFFRLHCQCVKYRPVGLSGPIGNGFPWTYFCVPLLCGFSWVGKLLHSHYRHTWSFRICFLGWRWLEIVQFGRSGSGLFLGLVIRRCRWSERCGFLPPMVGLWWCRPFAVLCLILSILYQLVFCPYVPWWMQYISQGTCVRFLGLDLAMCFINVFIALSHIDFYGL